MHLLIDGAQILLEQQDSAALEIVTTVFQKGQHSRMVHQGLFNLLKRHLTPAELEAIRPSWSKLEDKDWVKESREASRQAELRILNLIFKALGFVAWQVRPASSETHPSLGKLLAAISFWDSGVQEIYALRGDHLEGPTIEVLCGIIMACSLDPSTLASEVASALIEDNPSHKAYEATFDIDKRLVFDEPDWPLACTSNLDAGLLIDALAHPSWCVARPAADLLMACHKSEQTGKALKERISTARGHALRLCAAVGWECWGEEDRVLIILERLEGSLTCDCATLVAALPDLTNGLFQDRVDVLVREALASRQAELVEAGLSAIEKLGSLIDYRDTCMEELIWWINNGPQDPIGGGTVPPSAATSLLNSAIDYGLVGFDELTGWCSAGRRDVRSSAENGLCKLCEHDDSRLLQLVDLLKAGALSPNVLDRLSRYHGSLCSKIPEQIKLLLNHPSIGYRIAAVRSFGDAWAPKALAEELLTPLLSDSDPSVRDEALWALRSRTQA